jgi:hypothetical protein
MRILMLTALMFVSLCCDSTARDPDPTPPLAGHIQAAGEFAASADGHLAKTPPEVPAARADIKGVITNIGSAKVDTVDVSKKFNAEAAARAASDAETAKLKADFWSYRQHKLFWWGLAGAVLLGCLEVFGDLGFGWVSTLLGFVPLVVSKVVHFVMVGGVPHFVAFVKGVIAWIRTEAVAVEGHLFPQASVHPAVIAGSVPASSPNVTSAAATPPAA